MSWQCQVLTDLYMWILGLGLPILGIYPRVLVRSLVPGEFEKGKWGMSDEQSTEENQGMSLTAARLQVAKRILEDARNAPNGLPTRVTCALDAIYICALCICDVPRGFDNHPDARWIVAASGRLGIDDDELALVQRLMDSTSAPLDASESDLVQLIALVERCLASTAAGD